ncbi:VOC family protein [Yinghuangia soli]|uniref:VOC family protein n=1 Tax=Yinghuangia soli TaxID=2908204 RepID=A0AA41TY98_9ACTN|nr:VOC family protein [Yinghuangia soli]MCF2525930.1 VOC family protein [Yinghuangia soli]
MTSLVRHVTFDCHDTYTLAGFWAEVLGGKRSDEDYPGDPEAMVESDSVTLLFVRVPDDKQVKNRVHMDLQPQDRTRDEEVERLLALGAKVFDDQRRPDGTGWVTMQDLEGNEFCVERSAQERAAAVDA